jgi:hypothetical protein
MPDRIFTFLPLYLNCISQKYYDYRIFYIIVHYLFMITVINYEAFCFVNTELFSTKLRVTPEGRGFDSRRFHWNFSST